MTQTPSPQVDVGALIREIPDFPKPGIIFRDITTVLQDPNGWQRTVDLMCDQAADLHPDVILGIEARGFIMGAAMAYRMGLGFVPVRKPGKLPLKTHSVSYKLEYGSYSLEIHEDAIGTGEQVLVVDDLLATGGTAAAAAELVGQCGGEVVGFSLLIELLTLAGRRALPAGVPVRSLISY
jgi:adenine phosphoribosyltransferase